MSVFRSPTAQCTLLHSRMKVIHVVMRRLVRSLMAGAPFTHTRTHAQRVPICSHMQMSYNTFSWKAPICKGHWLSKLNLSFYESELNGFELTQPHGKVKPCS